MNLYLPFLLVLLEGIDSRTVVPGIHLIIFKPTQLAFIPDGTVSFIDADDVDVIMQSSTLLSEHLLVRLIENTACLTRIWRVVSMDRTEG